MMKTNLEPYYQYVNFNQRSLSPYLMLFIFTVMIWRLKNYLVCVPVVIMERLLALDIKGSMKKGLILN